MHVLTIFFLSPPRFIYSIIQQTSYSRCHVLSVTMVLIEILTLDSDLIWTMVYKWGQPTPHELKFGVELDLNPNSIEPCSSTLFLQSLYVCLNSCYHHVMVKRNWYFCVKILGYSPLFSEFVGSASLPMPKCPSSLKWQYPSPSQLLFLFIGKMPYLSNYPSLQLLTNQPLTPTTKPTTPSFSLSLSLWDLSTKGYAMP